MVSPEKRGTNMSNEQEQKPNLPEQPTDELSSEELDHVTGGALDACKPIAPTLPAVTPTLNFTIKLEQKGQTK
jgi:hypothetical protein